MQNRLEVSTKNEKKRSKLIRFLNFSVLLVASGFEGSLVQNVNERENKQTN